MEAEEKRISSRSAVNLSEILFALPALPISLSQSDGLIRVIVSRPAGFFAKMVALGATIFLLAPAFVFSLIFFNNPGGCRTGVRGLCVGARRRVRSAMRVALRR